MSSEEEDSLARGLDKASELRALLLDGLRRGLTNSEIARELELTPDAIKRAITQLLDETGLRDRDELVRWSRPEEESAPASDLPLSSPALPLLLSPAAIAVSLAIVFSVGIAGILLVLGEPQRSGRESSHDSGLRARALQIQTYLAGLPSPTPNPIRRPWVLDLERGEARAIDFFPPDSAFSVLGFAAWLEDGKSIFGSWAGAFGVVDVRGRLEATIPAPTSGFEYSVIALPVPGTRSLLVWRLASGELSILKVDSQMEEVLAYLPEAQDPSLSPDGSTLAFTRKRTEGVDVCCLTSATRVNVSYRLSPAKMLPPAAFSGLGTVAPSSLW